MIILPVLAMGPISFANAMIILIIIIVVNLTVITIMIIPPFELKIFLFLLIWLGVSLAKLVPKFLKFADSLVLVSALQRRRMMKLVSECSQSKELPKPMKKPFSYYIIS